jgi:hypothetical protein
MFFGPINKRYPLTYGRVVQCDPSGVCCLQAESVRVRPSAELFTVPAACIVILIFSKNKK